MSDKIELKLTITQARKLKMLLAGPSVTDPVLAQLYEVLAVQMNRYERDKLR